MSFGRAQDALVGRSLGEFVLRERIGQGGFGAVYRATQPALDREAVVKVLHARLLASGAASERFLREAKLASKLDHPYAAHIYAFGAEPDGALWIAMELVRGTPLDQLLEIQGPLPLERFVPLLDRICEVVHTAHEQGIVHRDLKPANVMVLARAGRMLPKLLDFGIAKGLVAGDAGTAETLDTPAPPMSETDVLGATIETPHAGGLTQRGTLVGSPAYMAPEQWLDAGAVDARTDVYALGILAYEALTGKPPFSGRTIAQLALAHASQPPPPLGSRFPAALDQVFARALAKLPADRYPDVLALAAAFRTAAGIGGEAPALPQIDAAVREVALTDAPQPIAEAIAALEAARNAHQARDAIAQVARTITRYLGLLALACRSRVSAGSDPVGVSDAMRALYRRTLGDAEWIELGRQLTRTWIGRSDAYPLPELIDAFHGASTAVADDLEALAALREVALADGMLSSAIGRLSRVLERLAFLGDYALVVTGAGGVAELWMGVRRTQRTTTAVRGKGVAAGVATLLDQDGVPVLSLAPLVQVAAPTPGAPLDLFLFDGRDRRGAKLVALPSGFEHHDDEVWDWFRAQLKGSFDETQTAAAEEKPPYRGLSAFSADDGTLFFGREKLVDAFANRLRVQPLLAVVGRSGAGKSSFVQAGVIPALPAGWRTITIRPGPSPLAALLARLEHAGIVVGPDFTVTTGTGETLDGPTPIPAAISARMELGPRATIGDALRTDATRHGPILLVVDQLEEMFTLCQDADERRRFAEALVSAARSTEDPVRVVCTLRDDFLVRTEQVPALRNRIAQGLQLLTVPGVEDLIRIIVEPARRAGYELEDPELPQEIVREVADQPGALALISFTAAKLWELRDRHFKQLTRVAYKSLGGVGGALAQHAELTLQEMLPEERALTREAFRHLVTTQNTRTVLRRRELRQLLGDSEHADRVMEKLVAARLLVASENESGAETIEIIHEALLSAWPRLVEWRREDTEGARFREQLRSAAVQWDERDRATGLLWRADALADFTRWRARHTGPLTDLEAAFANASLADAARGRRNRRLLLAAAFASLVAVVVGLVVFNTRITAAAQELHDNLQRQYENQGRRLVLESNPLEALAYLAKAAELGASGRAHDFLVAQAVRATDGELFEVREDTPLVSARFSHDGARLVTASVGRIARIWDARTGKPLATLPHADIVRAAVFSPDDTTVLTGSADGTAVLWNAATGVAIHRFVHEGSIWCVAYAPDGRFAMTASDDDSVAVWDLATGARRFRATGDGAGMRTCAVAHDGTLVATGDRRGTARVWDAASGAAIHELRSDDEINDVEFAPGDTRLVVGGGSTAIEWNPVTGERLQTLVHKGRVTAAAFARDGRSIATACDDDHTAAIWDAATGANRVTLHGHTAGVRAVSFTPDGTYLVTTAEDASAQLWDTRSGRRVARWLGHRDAVIGIDIDRSGERVVTAGKDGRAIVWRIRPQETVLWLTGQSGNIQTARFSSDGKRAVTASNNRTARVWDAATGAMQHEITWQSGIVDAVFSPDDRTFAMATEDGTVAIWDAATGAQRSRWVAGTSIVSQVAWSPDGSLLVAADFDGTIRAWETATGRIRFENRGHDGRAVIGVGFAPNGKTIVTTGRDSTARVWDTAGNLRATHPVEGDLFSVAFDASGRRVLSVARQVAVIWSPETGKTERELVGHVGLAITANWSPDGATAITTAADGTARMWDVETGDELAAFEHPGRAGAASISPNGDRVVIGDDDGTVAIHQLATYRATAPEFSRLLQCRVPFEVKDDRIQPRNRIRDGCE